MTNISEQADGVHVVGPPLQILATDGLGNTQAPWPQLDSKRLLAAADRARYYRMALAIGIRGSLRRHPSAARTS